MRRLDTDYTVFGADTHQYHLNPVCREAELATFETKHQITLPAGYRDFLSHIGNGGAGPYYGVAPLKYATCTDLGEGEVRDLSRPFPLQERWNFDFKTYSDAEYDVYHDDKWIDGLLYLGHYGCGITVNLVVNGPEYGNVWLDDRGHDNGIFPVSYSAYTSTTRCDFLGYYEHWLDEEIAGLSRNR